MIQLDPDDTSNNLRSRPAWLRRLVSAANASEHQRLHVAGPERDGGFRDCADCGITLLAADLQEGALVRWCCLPAGRALLRVCRRRPVGVPSCSEAGP